MRLGSSFKWLKVGSGMLQGNVLGLLLFLIYANDIDDCVISWVLKFADGMKLVRVEVNDDVMKMIQNNPNNLHSGSQNWLTLLNIKYQQVQGDAHGLQKLAY